MDNLRPMPGPGSAFIDHPAAFRGGHIAEPSIIVHKQAKDATEDGGVLDHIIQTQRCIRCTAMFKEGENSDNACHYHPGPSQSFIRNQNHLDRITFLCCGATQIGFQPVLLPAPCCKVGRHMSADDKKKQQEVAKSMRAAAVVASQAHGKENAPTPKGFGSSTKRR